MRLAVVSGKGGTGKTTVATSLAVRAVELGLSCTYLDCDVEEPNGWLFLRPELEHTSSVTRMLPVLDQASCTGCGACAAFCYYHALMLLAGELLLFPELCHGCGGCPLVCPANAIREGSRVVGEVRHGRSGSLHCKEGRLLMGEVDSPGVIRAVLDHKESSALEIVDGPPGAACPLVNSLKDADHVLLVCEPTPFGVHDFQLVLRVIQEMELPASVLINRSTGDDHLADEACAKAGLRVLARIPDDAQLRSLVSQGEVAVSRVESLREACDAVLCSLGVAACKH